MKNLTLLFCLSFTLACAQKEKATTDAKVPYNPSTPVLAVSMYNSPDIDHEIAKNNPYKVDFKVEQTDDGQYKLMTLIEVYGGSFYVSPHSTRDFKGKFRVEIAPNKNLLLGNEFVETPRSKEVIDPHQFVNGPVNWVSENTRYDHPLILNTKEDFQIGGKIVFVIEPKCTLEEIPLMFKYKDGILTVEPWEC